MVGQRGILSLGYWLDADDCIVRVTDNWDAIARAGDGEACLERYVLGQSLWSFVSGAPTRMLVARLLASVRAGGEPLRSAYRCDTPELRRLFELVIAPGGAGSLALTHQLVRVEPRQRTVSCHYAARGRHFDRCSLCNRLRIGAGWLDASRALALGHTDARVAVIYTVCADCKRDVERQIAGERLIRVSG